MRRHLEMIHSSSIYLLNYYIIYYIHFQVYSKDSGSLHLMKCTVKTDFR